MTIAGHGPNAISTMLDADGRIAFPMQGGGAHKLIG